MNSFLKIICGLISIISPCFLSAFPYLYVAQNDGTTSIFDIDSPTNPIYMSSAPGLEAFTLAIANNGSTLYGSSFNEGVIVPWDYITPGQPVFVQNIPGTYQPWAVLVPPNSPNFYVRNGGVDVFSVYAMINAANPSASALNPLQNINFFAISPNGTYLYTLGNPNVLETYDVSDPNNPVLQSSISIDATYLIMHPTGSNLYIVDTTNLLLAVFDLSTPSAPTLLPTNLPTGVNPQTVIVPPAGNYLYIANQGDNTLSVFDLQDPASPVAQPVFTSPNLSQPYGLISSPNGSCLYVSNQGSNVVSVLDTSSGGAPAWVQDLPVSQVPTYMTICAPFYYPFSRLTN